MKKLVESLVNAVLEADEKVIGIYGGGFKPPTAGHYEVIENILKTNPQLDKLYIAVGQKERDGITQADSLLVFDVYKKYFPFKVEFVPVKSVYNYIKDFVEENPDKTVIAFRGAREGQEEDLVDNETFKMFLDRYTPDVEYKQIKTLITGVSGTKARQALKSGNKEKFFKYLPSTLSNLDRDRIYDILTATVDENAKKAAVNAYSRELALGLEEQQGKVGYRAGSINPKTPQERLKDRGFALTRSTTGLLGTGFYFYGDKDQAVTSAKEDGRKNYTEIDLSQYKLYRPSSPEKFYNVIKNLTLLLTDLIFDEKVNFEDENVTKQLDLYSSYLSKELGLSDLEIELAAQSFIDDVAQSKDGVLLSNRILNDYDGIDLTGTSLDNFAVGSLIFDGKLKPGSYTSTKIQDLEEVGEATQKPYKWTVKKSYWEASLMEITYSFTTDKGIKYEALFYENADYRFDFLFYPEGGLAMDIVNKGELFRVMSTIVDIMKDFIKKEKWSVIEYASVKQHKGDERREKLYAAYLKKNLPDGIEVDELGGGDIMLTNLNLKEADPKKGTGKKPKGSGRRLYTDENPKDTVGIKFSTRQDIVDTLSKKSFKAKSHARQSQIINLIHQRVRAAYGRAKDPAVKKRLKSGLDYITKRKEASKKKTQRLKKQKVNESIDPKKRIDFYLTYFTNLSPSTFDLLIEGNHIKISGFEKSLQPGSDDTKIRQLPVKNFTKDGGFQELLSSLSDFLKQKLELQALPSLEYINDDVENAENILGNTAYYNPNTSTIVLYTKGRHPKDILRSYAHEMIHHHQNENGKFDGSINTFNINQDDYLKQIEEEAYLNGNILFRSWENTIEK